jgi:hypothetical protein
MNLWPQATGRQQERRRRRRLRGQPAARDSLCGLAGGKRIELAQSTAGAQRRGQGPRGEGGTDWPRPPSHSTVAPSVVAHHELSVAQRHGSWPTQEGRWLRKAMRAAQQRQRWAPRTVAQSSVQKRQRNDQHTAASSNGGARRPPMSVRVSDRKCGAASNFRDQIMRTRARDENSEEENQSHSLG